MTSLLLNIWERLRGEEIELSDESIWVNPSDKNDFEKLRLRIKEKTQRKPTQAELFRYLLKCYHEFESLKGEEEKHDGAGS